MKHYPILSAIAVLAAAPVHAQDFENLDILEARITEASAAVGIQPQTIDRRIRLQRCPETAVIDLHSPEMIAVRCPTLGWRIRVPVLQVKYGSAHEAIAVRRGEAVKVMIVGDDFSVSYDAMAMDDGAVGKSIRVKFLTNGGFLSATVVGQGKVRIDD
jgi:flagellar basal body P-ring formation protein FlgA